MSTSLSRLLAVASAAAVIGVPGAAAAAPMRPTTPQPACGSVITTDVRLTADVVGCAVGFVIGAPGITIDLDGHVLAGTGDGVGVENPAGHDRVRVTGGTIRDFRIGVDLLETRAGRLDRLALHGNIVGITLGRSTGTDIDRVLATGNTGDGISTTFSDRTTVRRSEISGNGANGIVDRFSTGSRHERNAVAGNAFTGIVMSDQRDGVVRRNDVAGNGFDGIQLGFDAQGVSIEGNHVSSNGERGIAIDEAGNRLARNTVVGNGGIGIEAAAGTIDGRGNRASANGGGDCTGVTCR